MEIRSSTNVVPAGTPGVRPQRRSAGGADEGSTSFTHSQALHDALAAEPEIREGRVAQLRRLQSDSAGGYPSPQVLKQVSGLIADRLSDPSGEPDSQASH